MAANGPPGGLPFHQYLQQQNQQQQQQNSFGFAQQQQTGQQPHHQQQQQHPHGMQAQQAAFPNIPAHLLQGLGSNQQQGQASPSSRNSTPQTLSQLQLLQASQQYQQQQQQRQQQQQHLRQAQQRPSSSSASLAQPLPHSLPHPAQAGPSSGPPSNVPQPAAIVHALRSRPGGLQPPRWYEVEGQEAKRRRDPGPEQSGLGFEWPSVKKTKWEDKHGREQIKFSRSQLKQAAKVDEHLIPIRLDFEEPIIFRDTFTWNALDPVITPELFAQSLVTDFHFQSAPANSATVSLRETIKAKIIQSIKEQLAQYQTMTALSTKPKLTSAAATDAAVEEREEGEAWWTRWRDSVDVARRRRKGKGRQVEGEDEQEGQEGLGKEQAMTLEQLARVKTPGAMAADDMRILVKLDITVGTLNLTDAFEWDINETDAAAEQFAEVYAADLGLAGEFKTAIAHDIREQSQAYVRSLILVGHPFDGTPVLDDDLRLAFLPPVGSVVRSEDVANSSFTPMFEKLDPGMIERREKEREKELKRKKRQTKGRRGVALPDREPKPSKRTVPSLGGVDANGLPIPAPDAPGVDALSIADAPPPSLRRAAAVAASASITQHANDDSVVSPPPSRSVTPEPIVYRQPMPSQQPPSKSHTPNAHLQAGRPRPTPTRATPSRVTPSRTADGSPLSFHDVASPNSASSGD